MSQPGWSQLEKLYDEAARRQNETQVVRWQHYRTVFGPWVHIKAVPARWYVRLWRWVRNIARRKS